MNWEREEDKPRPGEPVLVILKADRWTKQRFARACWIPRFFREEREDYEGTPDYNEEDDHFYWPEGWYEWNEYEEVHWQIEDSVTHWTYVIPPEEL